MEKTTAQLKQLQPVVMQQLQIIERKNRIGQAYIFEGRKGTATEEVAHFFVKLLLCEQPSDGEPCDVCRSCQRIENGNHINFHQVYPDGQFIKVAAIEELLIEMSKRGMEAGRKVYIVHEAERLNAQSANKLLKFLEEPIGEVTAIFTTQNINAMLPTICSRCQHIAFQPIPKHLLLEELRKQGVGTSIAATVSMVTSDVSEAIALTEDDEFAQARKTVLKLIEATLSKNVHEALLIVHEDWLPTFKERNQMELALDLLLYAYRDIVAVKANPTATLTYPDMKEFFVATSLRLTYEQLSSMLQAVLHARKTLHSNMNRTLLMEQLMLNLQEGKSFV